MHAAGLPKRIGALVFFHEKKIIWSSPGLSPGRLCDRVLYPLGYAPRAPMVLIVLSEDIMAQW